MLDLLPFRHSPDNEKMRWALDLKRVPRRPRSLLPGPQLAKVKRLTGRTTTPELLQEGGVPDGSVRIPKWLDAWPGPPALIVKQPAARPMGMRA